jgi:hypothetical protein
LRLIAQKYQIIAQGTDGCSQGVLMEGVMAGQDVSAPPTIVGVDLIMDNAS